MDSINLAEWQEYLYCEGTSYIAVCPYHAATMAAIPTMVANKEPFSTLNDMSQLYDDIQNKINSYDWANTGISGSRREPDINNLLTPQPDSIYNGGEFSLNDSTNYYESDCNLTLTDLVGPNLADSMCWAWNIMDYYGYTPWMSLAISLSSFVLLYAYLTYKWLDTISSA
jgi:hypothetical protein